MGWYHSHPFDVAVHSNAFLSATDVSTQLGWQLSEDAAGNPWLSLVVSGAPIFCVVRTSPMSRVCVICIRDGHGWLQSALLVLLPHTQRV